MLARLKYLGRVSREDATAGNPRIPACCERFCARESPACTCLTLDSRALRGCPEDAERSAMSDSHSGGRLKEKRAGSSVH